ncbi:MAG: hypothetical protein U0271_46155 [Polyangiaceae bacterium]
MRINRTSLSLTLASIVIAAAGAAAPGTGCSDNGPINLGTGGGDGGSASNGGSGTGGAGGVFVDDGKALFEELEADLVTTCATCHEPNGIGDAPFLAPPDRYASILAWPGIVVKNPQESLLLTYAVTGGGHSGSNLDTASNMLLERVTDWLTAEAANIADPIEEAKPHIDPITPILGFNAIYLTPLDPDLEGVAITFTAEELTDTSLKLSDIEVHATSKSGVHVVHPVFAVYPKGKPADADPVDSFADLDTRYDEGTSGPLGVGILILTNWAPEAKVGIGFELVEPYSSMTGTGGAGGGTVGPGGGCSNLAAFEANAKPQLNQRCFGCHGGNNGQATAAVDMSALNNDSAAACAQVLNRVNPNDPPSSQIFITTDPQGNAAHPFKFGGDANQFSAFRDQLTTWIQAE